MTKKKNLKIKKSEPPSLLAELQSVARHARTHTARHLAATGLYAGQEHIVQLLAEHDVMTPTELANALGVRPPTITKSLNRLMDQGFISRSKNPQDGRRVEIQLTELGNNLLNKAYKAARRAEKKALKNMTPSQVEQLSVLLRGLGTQLEKHNKKALEKASKRSAERLS